MLLNDVREDGDRIRPGEEAPSLSQTGCLPARIPMRVQVRRTGTRDELISDQKGGGDSGTHLFGQQGDEVSLKLRLYHLHHMLDLCGFTAVNQLIQRQQLLWASPALHNKGQKKWS